MLRKFGKIFTFPIQLYFNLLISICKIVNPQNLLKRTSFTIRIIELFETIRFRSHFSRFHNIYIIFLQFLLAPAYVCLIFREFLERFEMLWVIWHIVDFCETAYNVQCTPKIVKSSCKKGCNYCSKYLAKNLQFEGTH